MNDKATDELAKILWDYNNLHQTLEKSDCIIVLGSHDTRVAQRAAQIFLDGYASKIVFSGGFGRLTDKDWHETEAKVFSDIAIKTGVPIQNILIEDKSTNTGENIIFSKKLLDENNVKLEKVILVTKPYVERRAYATFKKFIPDIEVIVTSPQISFENYPNERISKQNVINVIVGDTQRIKLYPDKGFMVHQDIPANVWQAFEELVKRGFNTQLVKS